LIVVAFLLPLAVYCLVLGMINRRRRPLAVPGSWDCAALLFAVSGFLAIGLPGLLSGFSEYGREAVLVGPHTAGRDGAAGWMWERYENLCATLFVAGAPVVLIGYFAVVVAGAGWLLWRRRGQTVIYNIEADVFGEVLVGVLDAAGLAWSLAGTRYRISRRAGSGVEQSTWLQVESAPLLWHVTLHWQAWNDGVREQVEGELLPALARLRTRDNPMGTWLLTAGTALLSAAVSVLVFAVLYRLYGR
jgi:hypothetical protein